MPSKPGPAEARGSCLKRLSLAVIVILLLMCVSPSGYAEEGVGNPPAAAGMSQEPTDKTKEDDRLPIHKQDQWQFFLTPYLWIPGINFTTSTLKSTQGINVCWWDVVPDLFSKTIGDMGRAEAWKGRRGFYLDGYYTYLGASGSPVGATKEKTFGPVDFTLDKQLHLGGATINVPIPGQIGPGNRLTIARLADYGQERTNDLGATISFLQRGTFFFILRHQTSDCAGIG